MADVHTIRFAAFEVDPVNRELRKHGIRIRLQDQPFTILLALLERPGEVVSRDELRKRIWGDGTFVDFDHGLSAAVNRLREALGDSPERPRYIETLARRGYRFVAPVEAPALPEMPAIPAPVPTRPSRRLVWIPAAAALVIAIAIAVWFTRRDSSALPPVQLTQLTTFTGMEIDPTFAPDGKQVAFAWDGDRQDNFDIYVKMIGSTTALRLTSNPGRDDYPAWSPDGQQIAFSSSREDSGIYLVSPLGGGERKLTDIIADSRLSWSPDGRFLAVASSIMSRGGASDEGAVWLIPLEPGTTPRRILSPQKGTWYAHPAFSHDGRRLAVNTCSGVYPPAPACRLQILRLNPELLPEGEPQNIDLVKSQAVSSILLWGAVWSADRQFLIVSGSVTSGSLAASEEWLWRLPIRGSAVPQRLEIAGSGALSPAVDAAGRRLAFARSQWETDIWRWHPGQKASAFLTSSLEDGDPQFSHDGQRIAFGSRRGGKEVAIWVASRDGTGLAQITRRFGMSGTPRWSPDGRWIAFDAEGSNDRWDIWLVEPNSSAPRRLTDGIGSNVIPSWSHDGKWVYFSSNRSGRSEIWRVSSQSGPVEPVTRNGGYVAFASSDGKMLYYTKSEAGSEGLFAIPISGGTEARLIDDRVASRAFAVFPDGVYYISSGSQIEEQGNRTPAMPKRLSSDIQAYYFDPALRYHEIRFHEFATARNRVLGEIEGPLGLGLAVSPDRQTFLFSKLVVASDLMLIENFR